jgi:hypothetical protein
MDISRIKEAIAQRQDMQEPQGKKQEPAKKVSPIKPGLKFYGGGKEKTATGMSNAFKDAGIDEEQVYKFAQEFGLPTGSNKEFQEATVALLEKTPAGKAKLAEIDSKYGETKAGTLADNMLGARTVDMMRGIIQNKSAQEERERMSGITKYMVTLPGGDAYSYGQDKEGFEEFMKTKKIGGKAVKIEKDELERINKYFKRPSEEERIKEFLRKNPDAYSN